MSGFWRTFFEFLAVIVTVVLIIGGAAGIGAGLPWLLGAGEVLCAIGSVAGGVIGMGLVIAAAENLL